MAKKKKTEEVASISPMNDDKWKAEDDARTLTRAGEIMCDPKRMKAAKGHIGDQKKAMKSIDDIINYRNEKHGSSAEKDEE